MIRHVLRCTGCAPPDCDFDHCGRTCLRVKRRRKSGGHCLNLSTGPAHRAPGHEMSHLAYQMNCHGSYLTVRRMKMTGLMRTRHGMRKTILLRGMRMKNHPMSGLSHCGLRCIDCGLPDCDCGYHVRSYYCENCGKMSYHRASCCHCGMRIHRVSFENHESRYGSCLMTFA